MQTFFAKRYMESVNRANLPVLRAGHNKAIHNEVHALLGAGFQIDDPVWAALKAPVGKECYWGRCLVRSSYSVTCGNICGKACGKVERAKDVLQRMEKSSDLLKKVDISLYHFTETQNGWKIEKVVCEKVWNVEAKLSLSQKELESLLPLLEAFVPFGTEGEKTVSLQADSHQAGDCWVGLIASYDSKRIPFIPISGDIGCGMALLPIVSKNIKNVSTQVQNESQLKVCFNTAELSYEQIQNADEILKMKVCYRARKVLGRGKKAENGELEHSLIAEALTFLGGQLSDLIPWLNDFEKVLLDLDIPLKVSNSNNVSNESNNTSVNGLTENQSRVLKYILGFSMTLGSSGNHFLEMNADPEGYAYLTIHSGSRGLGAIIYQKIAAIAYVLMGSSAVAVGWLADLYNRAFAALNKFAILNRLCCGLAVLKDLSFVCDGSILRKVLIEQNKYFSGFNDKGGTLQPDTDREVSTLLKGVTHNGVKCFVNHRTSQKIFVLSKGAISISAQASCGIVALRAGEGVYLMTFLDPFANWIEQDLADLDKVVDYEEIYDLGKTDILLMGHGAGRSGSATGTWKNSEYKQIVEYYEKKNIWGNLSPNVLGDNPEIAYKPVAQVMAHLPLDKARSHAMLKTLVNHKEGIDYRPHTKEKFAQFVSDGWHDFSDKTKIMCDLVLVTQELTKMRGKAWFEAILAEQEALYQSLLDK